MVLYGRESHLKNEAVVHLPRNPKSQEKTKTDNVLLIISQSVALSTNFKVWSPAVKNTNEISFLKLAQECAHTAKQCSF